MFQFFRRNPSNHSIASLYGTIVAQARAAAFYQDFGVPDTVNGRFEMIVLHVLDERGIGDDAGAEHRHAPGQRQHGRPSA